MFGQGASGLMKSVDARQQQRPVVGRQVRRRLDVHLRAHDQARDRAGGHQLDESRFSGGGHRGVLLRPEVLDDHLLDVPVPVVQVAQGQDRLDPLQRGLADADEDAAGEGDPQLTGLADGGQARRRPLVRRVGMRAARLAEPVGDRLEHQPLAGRHLTQLRQLPAGQDAGVGMRQQAGLLQHAPAHLDQVAVGAGVAVALEDLAVPRPTDLGPVAQAEQRLLAASAPTGLGDREDLVGAHGVDPRITFVTGERAVRARVPAEVGQRDEHLARVGDHRGVPGVADRGGGGPERGMLGAADLRERQRLIAGESGAVERRLDDLAQLGTQRAKHGVHWNRGHLGTYGR